MNESAKDIQINGELPLPDFVQFIESDTNRDDLEPLVQDYMRIGMSRMPANAIARYTYYMHTPVELYTQIQSVLDVGAGEGYFKQGLAVLNPSTQVVTVDREASLHPDIIAEATDMSEIPDNSFDVVVSNYSIPNNLDDDTPDDLMAKEIEEMYRVVKVSGVVIFKPIQIYYDKNKSSPKRVEIENFNNVIKLIERLHKENPHAKFTIVRQYEKLMDRVWDMNGHYDDFIEHLIIEK